MLIVSGLQSGRGASPIVLAAVVLLPIALVLAASTNRRRRGRTWGELLSPLGHLPRPAWGAASYEFGVPVRRSIDRLYGLLLTDSNEVVLVRHDRHDQPPYYSLPGGTIQPEDESPGDVLAHSLGAAARSVEEWSLVHVERKAKHQELVFAGRLADDLDDARAASRHPLQLVPLTPPGLTHLDLHPHGAAEVVRRLAAERLA